MHGVVAVLFSATVAWMVPAAPLVPLTDPVNSDVAQRTGPAATVVVEPPPGFEVEVFGPARVVVDPPVDAGTAVVVGEAEFDEHAPTRAPPSNRPTTVTVTGVDLFDRAILT